MSDIDAILDQAEIVRKNLEKELADEREEFYRYSRSVVLNKKDINKKIASAMALGHKSVKIFESTLLYNVKKLFETPQYDNSLSILKELKTIYQKPSFRVTGETHSYVAYEEINGKVRDEFYTIKLSWNKTLKWFGTEDKSE